MEDLIQRLHHPGLNAILLDPFCGSGSTLVAANHFAGLNAIGCELNKDFRDRTINRLVEDYLISKELSLEDF